ncbi:paraquat-inducible protein A domain containing protein [Nitzschia inconspicua]|uniref:Paraquat-inducible protein A domain containing protein n=1 Tax=Nitzschia inconspicua TaxID=303405 RepID=A0A9K3KT39_9STRA|nr:paraquat-inducible protein A domain containing protein [Nitzschia inconspicua]
MTTPFDIVTTKRTRSRKVSARRIDVARRQGWKMTVISNLQLRPFVADNIHFKITKPIFLFAIVVLVKSVLVHAELIADFEVETTTTTILDNTQSLLLSSQQSQQYANSILEQPTVFTVIQNPPNCTQSSDSSDLSYHSNRLECFLWNLQVEIPERSFKKDFITITVHDMICTNFVLNGISSHYQPSEASNTSSPQLQISIDHLEASCQGRYHSTGGLAGDVQARVVEQDQGQNPAFTAVFSLEPAPSTPKVPSTCQTRSCATYLTCQGIHFSGSISARLIQAFSKTISKYITDALQTYICPKIIQETATATITKFLRHPFHDFVKKYLPKDDSFYNLSNYDTSSSSVLSSSASRTLITPSNASNDNGIRNVSDYNIIRWILKVFNQQLRDHLQIGWIPLPIDDHKHFSIEGTSSYMTLLVPKRTQSNQRLPDDCKDMFRGFSGWIKSIFGSRPRVRLPKYFHSIRVPLPAIPGAVISINISQVSVQGLDQMDHLQVLQPPAQKNNGTTWNDSINSQQHDNEDSLLQTNVTSSSGFFLVAPVTLMIALPEQETLIESFEVSLNITHVDIDLATILQVSGWDSMSMLTVVNAIQQFTDSFRRGHQLDWKAIECLIATVQKVKVQNWITNLAIESLQLSRDERLVPEGSLESDFDTTINTILQLLTIEYKDLWTLLVKGIVETLGTQNLNTFISDWISDHSDSAHHRNISYCISTLPSEGTTTNANWVNFTKFELLYKLNDFLGHAGRKKSLNHFLRCLGDSVEVWNENVILDVGLLQGDVRGGSISRIHDQISITRIETRNWDSLTELQLLKPTGETRLASSAILGIAGKKTYPEMTLVVNFDGPKLFGQLNVTAFANVEAHAELQIDYDLNRLENITIEMMLDHEECGLFPTMDARFLPGTTSFELGSFVGMNLTGKLNGKNIEVSTMAFPVFHEVGSEMVRWFVELARSSFNQGVAELTGLAVKNCPGVHTRSAEKQNESGKNNGAWAWLLSSTFLSISTLIVVFQVGLMWLMKSEIPSGHGGGTHGTHERHIRGRSTEGEDECEDSLVLSPGFSAFQDLIQPLMGKRSQQLKGRRGLDTPSSLDRSIVNDIYEDTMVEEEHQLVILEDQLPEVSEAEDKPKSIFFSQNLPKFVPYVFPATIFGTIVLLFTSNVSVGASVDMFLRLGTEYLEVPGVFRFSLGDTTSKLYLAGIYPLLLFVVFFSGIWPYVKLFWMLYACLSPCKDTYLRERRLLMLNALGKFSLVDSYVLILFVVAFRFHVELNESLGLDSYVTPVYGFNSFLLATILSLVLGHAMLFFHRKISKSKQNDVGKERILEHSFQCRDDDSPKSFTFLSQALLIGLMLCTMGLLIVGFLQESFSFEIVGLAGAAMGDDNNSASYSVLSLGMAIPQSIKDPATFQSSFLQMSYFLFTVFTPIASLSVMLVLMVWPLTHKFQRDLLMIAEALNAWSATEVFLLSIVAALFQISQFAAFLVGDKCDKLYQMVNTIFDGQEFNEVCFGVNASVQSNCWYLVAGTVLNSWVVSFALKIAHAAVEERGAILDVRQSAPTIRTTTPHQMNHGWTIVQTLNAVPVISSRLFVSTTENEGRRKPQNWHQA